MKLLEKVRQEIRRRNYSYSTEKRYSEWIVQDCLDRYTKSIMDMQILLMPRHGLMKVKDLDDFSEELRVWVRKVRQ